MASMRDIKRRKSSISSTQQITKAMKLVSTVKLQKAKTRAEQTTPYFDYMYKTVSSMLAKSGNINHPYLVSGDSPKKAVVVITSNRGLAGGYNTNITKLITGSEWNKEDLDIYAVGGNATAATFSGISTAKVKFIVHAYSGLMAGLAGVVLASRMYSGQPTAGDGAEMDAIAAVVVGGTSMSGGSGKIGGMIIGGLIIGVLNNGLNLLNVNSFWQYVVKGIVILLAVLLDFFRNKKK